MREYISLDTASPICSSIYIAVTSHIFLWTQRVTMSSEHLPPFRWTVSYCSSMLKGSDITFQWAQPWNRANYFLPSDSYLYDPDVSIFSRKYLCYSTLSGQCPRGVSGEMTSTTSPTWLSLCGVNHFFLSLRSVLVTILASNDPKNASLTRESVSTVFEDWSMSHQQTLVRTDRQLVLRTDRQLVQ